MKKTMTLLILMALIALSAMMMHGCGKSGGFGPGITILGGSS